MYVYNVDSVRHQVIDYYAAFENIQNCKGVLAFFCTCIGACVRSALYIPVVCLVMCIGCGNVVVPVNCIYHTMLFCVPQRHLVCVAVCCYWLCTLLCMYVLVVCVLLFRQLPWCVLTFVR